MSQHVCDWMKWMESKQYTCSRGTLAHASNKKIQSKRTVYCLYLSKFISSSVTILHGSGVAGSMGEGNIIIYSCSAQLISFEIESVSKEINCAEHEYMNMSPLLIELATPLIHGTSLIFYKANFLVFLLDHSNTNERSFNDGRLSMCKVASRNMFVKSYS